MAISDSASSSYECQTGLGCVYKPPVSTCRHWTTSFLSFTRHCSGGHEVAAVLDDAASDSLLHRANSTPDSHSQNAAKKVLQKVPPSFPCMNRFSWHTSSSSSAAALLSIDALLVISD